MTINCKQLGLGIGYDIASTTLANDFKEPQCVVAGFVGRQGAKSGSVGFEYDISPTLRQGITTEVVYSLQGNGIDKTHEVRCYDIGEARLRTPSEYVEVSPTITARCGTGGNNVPAVCGVYCLQGNGIDRADTAEGGCTLMFVQYCDICGRSLNEELEYEPESRQYIMEVRVAGHGDILDIELCKRCKHTMYYLMQNPELLKKHVIDMKLHNRIRYLFKMRLKEGK